MKRGYLNLAGMSILLVFYIGCAGTNRHPDPWFGADKVYHFCAAH